jgi:RHS repeat-associated protein
MGDWYYYYDGNGNLTQQIDSKGQTINFYYDPLNRLWKKQYQDANQTTYTYSYDDMSSYNYNGTQTQNYGTGRLALVVDNIASPNSSGATQFFYDKLGRTSMVSRSIDGNLYNNGNPYTTQFQYDPLGHVTRITYPDNDQANYAYDTAGNMTTVSNSASVAYATFSGYNAFGQVTQIGFNNGANTTLAYDLNNINRLQELKTTDSGNNTVQDFVYGYDKNGNITSIADSVTAANSQTFTYDWLNRLTSATSTAYGTLNYNTDAVGNVENPPNTANPAWQNSRSGLVFDYDNRLTSITTGGSTTQFVYDYTGARVKKMGANIVTYVSRLYEVRNGTVTKYVFAGGRRIAFITGSNIYYYHPDHLRCGAGQLVSGIALNCTRHLGSLSIATYGNGTGNGTVAEQVTYYPYGEVRTDSGSLNPPLPYKFTGKELDSETGLYYFGARYYDAAQGRFMTPDTIVQSPGNPQTLNRYAYAGNNPLAFVDPTGHFSILGLFCDILDICFAFAGMPFVGAAVTSAISTFGNGGGVDAFLLGLGVNAWAGIVAGPIAGGLGSAMGMSAASLGTAVLRGTLAGAITGAGMAAIYHQNVGLGALEGAAGGAAASAAIWAYYDYRTSQFLKNNVIIDQTIKDAGLEDQTVQRIREVGQSPVGQRLFSGFINSGAQITFQRFPDWMPDYQDSDNGYTKGNRTALGDRIDAAGVVHELSHATRGFGFSFPGTVSGSPEYWNFENSANNTENLYRAWIGMKALTVIPDTNIPLSPRFLDTFLYSY